MTCGGFFVSLWSTLTITASESNIPTLFTGGSILFITTITIAGGIILLFNMAIFWLVSTLILYAITMVFKGTGSIRKTAQNLGFAEAFGLMIFGVIAFSFAVTAIAISFSGDNFGTSLQNNSLFITVINVGIIFLMIWTGYLMALALQYARNLPFVKAAVAVAVPLGALLLVYTYSASLSILY